MKLRNFLYIDSKILDDYIATIDGYVYEEETQKINETSQKAAAAKGNVFVFSGDGKIENQQTEAVERKVHISDAAKFDKLYKYLSADEESPLKYFEFLREEDFNNLYRDDFIEVLVIPRFSKMRELSKTVKKINSLAHIFENITQQSILDTKAEEAINGFAALGNLKNGSGLSCVFSFEDSKYPLVGVLNETYLKCEQSQFIGQCCMLCKIQRKILKGQNIKLDEIFEDIKKLPLNREQRRKMPKNLDNPDVIRDVIKGPALQIIPVAIYQ